MGGAWLLAAALLLLAGCGAKEPPRYDLSGRVTYQGAPVPRGIIHFVPDMARGNDGLGAEAVIYDGKFQTPPAKGTIGGPHIAAVDGFDGVKPPDEPSDSHQRRPRNADILGTRLFPTVYVKVELPRQAATHDFTLPEE